MATFTILPNADFNTIRNGEVVIRFPESMMEQGDEVWVGDSVIAAEMEELTGLSGTVVRVWTASNNIRYIAVKLDD